MKTTSKTLVILTLFFAVLTTTNANAEITCEDYPDKDLVILLDESYNNVSLSEYVQNSDLEEGWYVSASYDLSLDEVKDLIQDMGVVTWSDYDKGAYLGMHYQFIEVGGDGARVIIEKFAETSAAKEIYQEYSKLYDDATNVEDMERLNSLGVVGYGARIEHGSYVIKFVDKNNRLIHISSVNKSIARYVADRYSNLKNSLIVSGEGRWRALVCKAQTDECTQSFYFSSVYDTYTLLNCSTVHNGKRLACPDSRIEKYTGSMQVPFPSCEKGDILDIAYEKTTEFPIKNQFWSPADFYFQDTFPIEKSVLKLEVPNNMRVKYFSTQDVNPIEMKQGNRTTYTWMKESSEPFEYEGLMPPVSEVIPHAGYTSLQSWGEVQTWFEGMFTDAIDKAAVKAKVIELTAGKTTDEEKSQAIYYWVRDQIRYDDSGMGFLAGYKPHSAGEVFDYKFGDCKDHAVLIISMLEAAGIKAYPVLVSEDEVTGDSPPTPYQFYHAIVAVPNGSSFIWLDPTCKYCPYGFIDEEEQDADILMLSNPSTTFTKTPVNDNDMNYRAEFNYTVSLRSSGNAQVEINLMESGSYGLAWKYKLKDADRETVKKGFDPIIKTVCSDYDLDDYAIINSADEQSLLMNINVTCNNLASKSGNKTIYNIPTEDMYSTTISKEERKYPLLLKANNHVVQNMELMIPEGLGLELMPERYSDNSQFATYSFKCSSNDTILTCRWDFKENAIEIPASDFSTFKKFYGTINSLKRTIILSPATEKKVAEPEKTPEEGAVGEIKATTTTLAPVSTETKGAGNQSDMMPILIGGGVVVVLIVVGAVVVLKKKKK